MGVIDILSRLWRGSARVRGRRGATEKAPDAEAKAAPEASPATAQRPPTSDTPVAERDEAEPNVPEQEDDLTAIKGIGVATQQRLRVAGIKSYSQWARATPKEVARALVGSRRGARVEEWIRRASELAERQ